MVRRVVVPHLDRAERVADAAALARSREALQKAYEQLTLVNRDLERKTTITSSAVGSATSGVLNPMRIPGIVPAAEVRLSIRDILPTGTTSANAIGPTCSSWMATYHSEISSSPPASARGWPLPGN